MISDKRNFNVCINSVDFCNINSRQRDSRNSIECKYDGEDD